MSYGLKYTIPFKSISEKSCVIRLEVKDYTGATIELVAGADPILIETDNGDLLIPIRGSSATLEVFGSDYLQDLYTSDPQGIRVTLLVDDVIKWLGYLTPDTFSQNFTSPEFIYQMEAVSALSTLKYKKFDLTADFVTFREILTKALEYAGYSDAYLTNAVRTTSADYFSLSVASANFYDELDEAMTYYQVLEEIAKYAGCCFTPFEDKLYFLDYKAIREGYNSYSFLNGSAGSLSDINDVNEYRGTGAKLSRIPGKNKATVSCSLYEIKELLPEFDESKSSVYAPDPMTEYTEQVKVGKESVEYRGIIRRYNQPKFTFFHYGATPSSPTEAIFPPTGSDIGSGFVRTAEYRLDTPPNTLNMTNEVQVKMYSTYENLYAGKHLKNTHPVIRIKSDRTTIIHKDVWFCLGLQIRYSPIEWTKDIAGIDFKASEDLAIHQRAMLRIGKYYYTGSGWSKTQSTFTVPITIKKGNGILSTTFSVDNTNSFDKGLGDLAGHLFKAPPFPIMGDLELTIYATPAPVMLLYPVAQVGVQYMYYRGIELSYGVPDDSSIWGDWVGGDTKNDVIYENEIFDSYTEEADDIDLKISTNPDGKLALSSVIQGTEPNADFIATLVSDVYGQEKAENILLMRVVDLYKTPRFSVTPTLKNEAKPYSVYIEPHLNNVYMVAGGEEDIKMESATYNLIEL